MNKDFYRILNAMCILAICALSSCSKSSSSSGNPNPSDTTTTTVDTVPANIVDIKGTNGSGINLNPYPGIPAISNLILVSGLGYYYIDIGGGDTLTFILQADSTGGTGSGASISGQTSDSGPNYFTSGDSLGFLVTAVQYSGQFGGTGTAYYANDLSYAYSLSGADTLNFSGSYNGAQIYSGSINSNGTYNLLNRLAYIAFRLKNSSGYRYGWMMVSSDPSGGNLLAVYEIAYNKNYSVAISVGGYK